jgi:putative ABC transport system permease protein
VNAGFALRMARREARAGARRIGVFMLAVALGVAALTGLHAFQLDAAKGARAEARSLLGGDLRIQSTAPFGAGIGSLLDSLRAEGFEVSRSVTLGSMVSDLEGRGARLLQVNAVDSLFPVAGSPDSEPVGAWDRLGDGGKAVAERSTLLQVGVAVGDSLQVAGLRLSVAGTVTGLPIDPGIQSVVGPPIFIALADLEQTDLLDRGSLAQHRAFLAVPGPGSPAEIARFLQARISEIDDAPARVSIRTAQEEAEALAEGFQALARFLGLVGFMALLLGGVGVASAVQLYIEERMEGIAVLRCLGAGQGTVFGVYIVQTVLLGASGALLGVLLGVAIQFALPAVFAGMLPFRFDSVLRPGTMLLGMLVGTGVAVLFALIPLLRVREIPPLAAFRLDVEAGVARRGLPRVAAAVGIGASILTLAVLQTGASSKVRSLRRLSEGCSWPCGDCRGFWWALPDVWCREGLRSLCARGYRDSSVRGTRPGSC